MNEACEGKLAEIEGQLLATEKVARQLNPNDNSHSASENLKMIADKARGMYSERDDGAAALWFLKKSLTAAQQENRRLCGGR